MKTICDNNCATCTQQTQIHCNLLFSKSNNELLKRISESMFNDKENTILIKPCSFENETITTQN